MKKRGGLLENFTVNIYFYLKKFPYPFQYSMVILKKEQKKAVKKYMNVLIADPDRDFLMSYKALLELSENTVQTVFDGTQVISKLASEKFDAVIINENIPRIKCREIVKVLNDDGIPVIVITERKEKFNTADDCIKLPFLPSELTGKLNVIYSKKAGE